MRTYALLDGGSTRHVISNELCKNLGIEGDEVRMSVTTLDFLHSRIRRLDKRRYL